MGPSKSMSRISRCQAKAMPAPPPPSCSRCLALPIRTGRRPSGINPASPGLWGPIAVTERTQDDVTVAADVTGQAAYQGHHGVAVAVVAGAGRQGVGPVGHRVAVGPGRYGVRVAATLGSIGHRRGQLQSRL